MPTMPRSETDPIDPPATAPSLAPWRREALERWLGVSS